MTYDPEVPVEYRN